MWKPCLAVAALVALIGCSGGSEEPSAAAGTPPSVIQAELARFEAEGIEPLARQLAMGDYFLHYHLMQAAEMFEELGGEEQAIAALIAVGEAHERNVRWGEEAAPRMIPAQFGGEGMQAGMYGFGAASFVGVLVDQLTRDSGFKSTMETYIEQLSDPSIPKREVGTYADGVEVLVSEDGHYVERTTNVDRNRDIHSKDYGEQTGDMSMTTTEIDSNGFRSTTERITQGKTTGKATVGMDRDGAVMFESIVNEKGMQGRISVRVRMDTCPDAQGKVTVNMTVNSRICVAGKAGTCGNVHADFELERYLDDDAHLAELSKKDSSALRLMMGGRDGGRKVSLDVSVGQKDGKPTYTENKTEGLSIFRPGEVRSAEKSIAEIYNYMAMLAEMMLRGMGKKSPWESGRCVEVEVKTNPEKRTGADPGTSYRITVIPRARSDGQVTTGTVRATLSGDSSLDPADTKVKVEADAKFQYDNPTEKDKKASIAFEARSKRGVGWATADFDTKNKSYELHGCRITGKICNVEEPFSVVANRMLTYQCTPAAPDYKDGNCKGSMSFGAAKATMDGRYRVELRQDGTGGTFHSTGGGTVSAGGRAYQTANQDHEEVCHLVEADPCR